MPSTDNTSPEIVILAPEGEGQEGNCCENKKWVCTLNIVTAVLYAVYYAFLVWLLVHLKKNSSYYALISLPLFCDILLFVIFICHRGYQIVVASLQAFRVTAVVLTLMSMFTLLTRHAFYHVSNKEFIGRNFIIVSLKGSVLVFLWDLLSQRHFNLVQIKKDKDVITRIILDNVDIFNMVEFLVVQSATGSSLIDEDSPLEKVIQTFCTLSFLICWAETLYVCTTEYEGRQHPLRHTFSVVYYVSVFLQNIPFLIIRVYIWVKYDLYSLGFLVKNLLAIIFGITEIFTAYTVCVQREQYVQVN